MGYQNNTLSIPEVDGVPTVLTASIATTTAVIIAVIVVILIIIRKSRPSTAIQPVGEIPTSVTPRRQAWPAGGVIAQNPNGQSVVAT